VSQSKVVAVLATLDTKGEEAQFLREQLEALGSRALVVDMGVIGEPSVRADLTRETVAAAGGTPLAELLSDPSRESAAPVMVAGATRILREKVEAGEVHAILGMGGFQGTSACSQVMRAMPYGLPKVLVSTAASGDTSSYVDIKDVTMMFSVGDILGLNAFTRRILANAAGAAHGMASIEMPVTARGDDKPLIGMSNLGVLTKGAMVALERFAERGFRILSVSFDGDRDDVRAYWEKQPMPWDHAFVGSRGLSQGPISDAYALTGLPYVVLVGPDGTVLALESELRGDRLERTLARVLPEG